MVGSHLSQGPVKLEIICDWEKREKYGKILRHGLSAWTPFSSWAGWAASSSTRDLTEEKIGWFHDIPYDSYDSYKLDSQKRPQYLNVPRKHLPFGYCSLHASFVPSSPNRTWVEGPQKAEGSLPKKKNNSNFSHIS